MPEYSMFNPGPTVLLLAVGSFGAELLISTEATQYLRVFINQYHLPTSYLSVVQILFLVWNAINDPILGYMQDLGFCGIKWIMDRRKVMLYGGPFFSFSFLLFWFPWSTSVAWVTASQLLVSLFLFDTLFTLVLSAYCGLCVEKSATHVDRVRVTVYAELFGLLAGFMIFPVEYVTGNLSKFNIFQICCVFISILSTVCMLVCAKNLSRDKVQPGEEVEMTKTGDGSKGGVRTVLEISWQIIKEPRFICLVGGQFFKILRFMGNEQFLIMSVETLLVQSGYIEKGSAWIGVYYVVARSLGSILFLSLWIAVNKVGCQWVLQGINVLSLLNCAVTFWFGWNKPALVFAFILIENAFSRCGWNGYYLVIAGEVIDADKERHSRTSPLSTIIFTMKALFSKPADQLAPLIILFFLEKGNYTKNKVLCSTTYAATNGTDVLGHISQHFSTSLVSSEDCATIYSSMFYTMVLFPAGCAICESIFLCFDQLIRRNQKHDKPSEIE